MEGSKRRTREEWAERNQANKRSRPFAHHLIRHTFQYWRGKLRQEENDSQGFVHLRSKVLGLRNCLDFLVL